MNKATTGLLFIIGLLASFFFFYTLTLHNDHIQILDKAFLYVETGVVTHFGNAATGVGYIPGTFQTLISALPMRVYFSPYSAAAVIVIFHFVCLLLITSVLKKSAGEAIVPIFMLIYWVNPWRVEQSELYNPGYLFLFSGLHFYTSYYMNKRSFWLSFVNTLAIGLCVQVHYSAVVLGVLTLILIYTRTIRIHWGGFAAGVGVFTLSLAPYLWQLFYNPPVDLIGSQNEGSGFFFKNFLLVYPVLKGITYWIRYGAISYGRHIFSEIHFLWISSESLRTLVDIIFHTLKWPIAAATVAWSVTTQFKIGRKIWRERPFLRHQDRTVVTGLERVHLYAFYMFFAMIIAVGISPVELNHWHLILCFPTIAAIVSLALLELSKTRSPRQNRLLFLSIFLIFVTFNVLGALGSRTHSFKSDFHRDTLLYYEQWKSKHL